jgi:hypothetical protein
MPEPRFVPAFALMLGGLIVWAAHFLFIYGATGLLCARPEWAQTQLLGLNIIRLTVAISTVAALVAIGALCALAPRMAAAGFSVMNPRFYRQITCWIGGLSALAVVWQGGFTFIVGLCV